MKSSSYATLAVANAIKTSVATSTSPASYSGGALNGAIGAAAMVPARSVSVTTAANAATYTGTAIVVNGTDSEGRAQSETLTLTQAGGNETIVGSKGFRTVTSIDVPAQANTGGAFTFGVRDIVCAAKPPKAVRVGGAGNLKVQYSDGSIDTIGAAAGEKLDIDPHKIFGDAGTTATNVSLLF